MARIFLTGATGLIGGDVLHALKTAHPDYRISTLVRDSVKAESVSKAYPNVRIVLGDLDSASIIEEEASQADVVVHAAANKHISSVEAIVRGLAKHTGPKPGYLIQVSGASLLSIPDIVNQTFGEGSSRVYGDLGDANEIRDIIRKNADKRVVDSFLLNVTGTKTAIIFPPIIYGQGRGPVNQRSIQVPEISRVAIEKRQTFQVGKGESIWSNIHVSDLSDMFVKLVEKAVEGAEGDLWNENGLYFVDGGPQLSFGKISQLVADSAHKLGLTDSATVQSITPGEADALSPAASVFWGTNARQSPQRALQLLGWTPCAHSLEEEIPTTVRLEATRLAKL